MTAVFNGSLFGFFRSEQIFLQIALINEVRADSSVFYRHILMCNKIGCKSGILQCFCIFLRVRCNNGMHCCYCCLLSTNPLLDEATCGAASSTNVSDGCSSIESARACNNSSSSSCSCCKFKSCIERASARASSAS